MSTDQALPATILADDAVAETPFYIPATGTATRPRRTLKYGDSFAVVDTYGDIGASAGDADGLFHNDTRFLSHLELLVNGEQPLLLGSNLRDDNTLLSVDLTNPDFFVDGRIVLQKDLLHISRTIFLWRGRAYQRLAVRNHGDHNISLSLTLLFRSDFADLFEVRGLRRARRGSATNRVIGADRAMLSYLGLDGVSRTTTLSFEPQPDELSAGKASYHLELAPGELCPIFLIIGCNQPADQHSVGFIKGMISARRELRDATRDATTVETSNALLNEILCRSAADLEMLMTDTPEGRYPYAGIPWYSTTFGRDGLITALQMLWCDPSVARGVLRRLAAYQAKATDPLSDAEPGKILHEMRKGEMAALHEVPFALYYGSVDATPLFVLLAGLYAERTDDQETLAALWPAIEAALGWIDGLGDRDGDGFVEYRRASELGLANQGWKDSQDAIFHADGRLAEGNIALAEVQGYVFAAKTVIARSARRMGLLADARRLEADAERLARRFEAAFWCPELGTYALALDGAKAAVPRPDVECRTAPVHRHRAARARRAGRCRIARAALLFGLGHSHRAPGRGALQPDVLSRRFGVAARQRADCPGPGALRLEAIGLPVVHRPVRRRDLHGSAAIAGTLLRLPAPAQPRADALPCRLLAAGLGERHAILVDRGGPRTGARSAAP